jgi:hypothetical protein
VGNCCDDSCSGCVPGAVIFCYDSCIGPPEYCMEDVQQTCQPDGTWGPCKETGATFNPSTDCIHFWDGCDLNGGSGSYAGQCDSAFAGCSQKFDSVCPNEGQGVGDFGSGSPLPPEGGGGLGGLGGLGGYGSAGALVREQHHRFTLARGVTTVVPFKWRDAAGIAPAADLWVDAGGKTVLQVTSINGTPFARAGLQVIPLVAGKGYGLTLENSASGVHVKLTAAGPDKSVLVDVPVPASGGAATVVDVLVPGAPARKAVTSTLL